MAPQCYRVAGNGAIVVRMKYAPPNNVSSSLFLFTMPLICLLSGCAGTHIRAEEMSAAQLKLAQPHSVAVSIIDESPVPRRPTRITTHAHDVALAEHALAKDLAQILASRRLSVVGPGDQADLVLVCAVTDVRSGSTMARLLVGYGAGKAVLGTRITISAPRASNEPLLAFGTNSTTGAMPGAGIGVMSAAGAAGTAVHMIGPLLGVPGTLRQGLAQEARQTSARIDDELAKLFDKQGWVYPRPPASFPSRS